MKKWIDTIEKPIRPIVKLLRENGINTTSSCGHEMTIQAGQGGDGDMTIVYNLLVENGWDKFRITSYWENHPFPRRWMEIEIL